ncbi:hypothetical protein F4677DRAFT_129626 [Hypoxylon crocopeplum]|nr:hypothetical protein F4677DRAFT_129626 [Hypoxylon crocopeplum]
MQFTMGRSVGDHRASGAARQAAAKPEPSRQNHTKQHRHGKSQPFDADDLRRRLYVVLAEQEALKEKRRRERLEEGSRATQNEEYSTPMSRQSGIGKTDTAVLKSANTMPEASEASFAARVARSKHATVNPHQKEGSAKSSEPKLGRSMSRSIQDKLRRKPSRVAPVSTESELRAPLYHHVPQEAATQFERTATANSMREKNLVHSLSQSAIKFHVEGRPSDQIELDSSITPAQQSRALKRAQSHREKMHERNQFQNLGPVADERRSSEESRHHRRHSSIGLNPVKSGRKASFGYIPEDEPLTVHATAASDLPIDEISSEETLVVDPAAAHEHRVDWTQSDEMYERRKAGARNPLLRKADSLWTLKGKLGHRAKSSYSRDEKMSPLREKQEKGLTSPSPPKFLRLGFLTRFRR